MKYIIWWSCVLFVWEVEKNLQFKEPRPIQEEGLIHLVAYVCFFSLCRRLLFCFALSIVIQFATL